MPVLAICRGLQLVNVARGGTLHQHLPEALGTERYRIGGGVFATNEVVVDDGSRLAGLVGAGRARRPQLPPPGHRPARRRARRHRADRRRPRAGVRVRRATATSSGVQWHPEENAEDRRLFAGLVAEASEYRAHRRRVERVQRMSGTFTVINPATGQRAPRGRARDVEDVDAVDRARRSTPSGRGRRSRRSPARMRCAEFARVVEDHVEELAQLEVLNSGHPIGSARWEASHVAQVLNFYAGAPERLSGSRSRSRAGSTSRSTSRTAWSGSSCRGTSR